MKKLYLFSQDINTGYDMYDSCVVCADTEQEAITISVEKLSRLGCWVEPKDIKIKQLSKSVERDIEKGIIVSSFNAG